MTSSHSGLKSTGAFAFPALPVISHRPETVVNPEGRGSEGSSLASPANHPNSSIWQRLFPQALGSSDEEWGGTVPTPEGFELGHFVLQQRIGIGGMGAVFRAMDTRLQRVVALKVLGPAQSRDESSVKRFQNEASAAARLDHDNIARVFYIGEDQGLHFIAFEYIKGTNLRDLIREGGPISPLDAVSYTLQIAGALNHTYAAGVVHRDIKPSNIIIMPSRRAKLVDLGLARKQNSDSVAELTLAGTTLGTFDYISPEQAKDPRTADVRSDIYSLGCTLYHALTGTPPYPEGTVLQKLLDHQGKEAPDPALKNRNVPADLSAICRKMMASDPKQRYATPELLVRDLMPIAARMGLRGLPADGLIWRHVTPPKETFWQRNMGWLASVSVLLLIVFVIWRFPGLGSGPSTHSLAEAGQPSPRNFSPLPRKTPEPASDLGSQNASPTPKNSPVPATPKTEQGANSTNSTGTKTEPNESPEISPAKAAVSDLLSPQPASLPAKMPFGLKSALEPGDDEPTELASNSNPGSRLPMPAKLPTESIPDQPTQAPEVEGPAKPPAVPMTEIEMRPYWIIHNDGSEDEGKLTLEAACTAAADGQIVEIRHNGPLPDSLTKPIRIKNKSLTIRAGENFRPLLLFSGVETPAEGLLTRLFRLSNAEVDLINLDFHVAPKRGAASEETWALVSLEGKGRVLLQGVTVTVEEAGRNSAAIVELLPAPASQTAKDMKMMNPDNNGPAASFEVKVFKSFLRGRCDVFLSRNTLPGRIHVEQSAIAVVEGSLLHSEGDLDMKDEKDHVELTLDHTTCLVGNSLIRLDSGDTPRDLLPIHVRNTRDNLIATNTSNPLISMTGRSDPDTFEHLLRWDGLKNFYDGFAVFWAVSSAEFPPRKFDAWVRDWTRTPGTKEEGTLNGGFAWQGNWTFTEFPEITPADLTLKRDPANPAIDGATDRTNVGADLAQLPSPPHRTASTP